MPRQAKRSASDAQLDESSLSCDGAPLSAYAKKVPEVRRGGDPAKHEQAVLRRRSFVKIVDILSKRPEHILETLAHLENQEVKAKEEKSDKNDYFLPQYTKLWRISHNWWASWLVANSNGALTAEMMHSMTLHNPKVPQMVAFFLCQLAPGDVLPKILLNKKIASRVFAKRARDLGRWPFVAGSLNRDGSISWARLGPYELSWKEGLSSAIKHKPSGLTVAVPPDGVFRIDAEISNPHLDCVAAAKGRIQALPLWKYFDAGVGPNQHKLDSEGKILQEMGKQFELQIQCQVAQLQRGDVQEDPTLMAERNLEEKLQVLARARQMLANRRAPLTVPAAPTAPALLDAMAEGAALALDDAPAAGA